jgi:DNA-binding NtrC family response regulator
MVSRVYEYPGTDKYAEITSVPATDKQPTILVATVEPEIRASMSELLENYNVKTIWVTGLEELRLALTRENIAACFCGFWLVDGTCRDVVHQLKRQHAEIPIIVVCAPECSQEYRDYLAALNIRAFDYICYPYRKVDLERILYSAISPATPSTRTENAQRKPDMIASHTDKLPRAS